MKPLWIARVNGTQEDMGRQHGALLAAAGGAEAVIAHYRDMPARLIRNGELTPVAAPGASAASLAAVWAAAQQRLSAAGARAAEVASYAAVRGVSEVLLRRLAADRPPELRGRSRAFMRALGMPADTDRYLGVMDLFQNFVGTAARWGLGPFRRPAEAAMAAAAIPACSTVVAWGGAAAGGALHHARNFDFPGIGVWDAAPAVVLCTPDRGMRYGFVTTRGADTPVVTVFNEAGLVITSHTRFHTTVAFRGAAIVDLVHDLGRRAETLADAERIARERPVSSTWGLAVSSARERRAVAIEIHAGRVAVVEPGPGSEHLVCCNRYRHPTMIEGEVASSPAWGLHSGRRERRLHALVDAARARGGADWRTLAAMLTDREDADAPGVTRHLGGVVAQPCQVQSIVVVPDTRTLWLGTGAAPVGEGRWQRLTWDWSAAPATPAGLAWELGQPVPRDLGVTVEDAGEIRRSPASDAVAQMLAIEQQSHDGPAITAQLERAIEAAPDDPSLRLAMVWYELRRGAWSRAADEAAHGLRRETLPYRRGQLLLWGARAATAAGDAARAAAWRADLADLRGDGVLYLQQLAGRDAAKPAAAFHRKPTVHLTLLDANY